MTLQNGKWPTHYTFGFIVLLGGSVWVVVGVAIGIIIRLLAL